MLLLMMARLELGETSDYRLVPTRPPPNDKARPANGHQQD